MPKPERVRRNVAGSKYRLSKQAEAQLLAIFDYTEKTFGPYQAKAYHAGFVHIFALLTQFPRIGHLLDEILPDYRRYRFQSHFIFYKEEADTILIASILHASQKIRPDLFD